MYYKSLIISGLFLTLLVLEGCYGHPAPVSGDGHQNVVAPNPIINSSTSVSQPDPEQPATIGNVSF